MYSDIDIGGLALVVGILVLLIGGFVLFQRWKKKKDKAPKSSRAFQIAKSVKTESGTPEEPENINEKEDGLDNEDLDGEETHGDGFKGYPAYICTLDGAFDFDYIPKPMGDVFPADTSMTHAGPCYLVRETKAAVVKKGKVIEQAEYEPYDPRTAPVISNDSPIKAWFATHWDILKEVYGVTVLWYKSVALWIAGVSGLAAFIIILARVG